MDYPYVKCLYPQRIVAKNGAYKIVPCGKCTACQIKKSRQNSLLCQLMEKQFKYTMFVTLTYSNEYYPRFKISYDYANGTYLYVNQTPRLDKYGISTSVELSKFDIVKLPLLIEKANLGNNNLGYSSKHDLQNFLKRFRKNLSKYEKEKIFYYAVSEYGPIHFRGHFHLLFYFNSRITFEKFGQVLHSSWQFGRIDFSLSRGQTSGYVAQYLNSTSYIPEILRKGFAKPFQVHSTSFALPQVEAVAKTIYENDIRAVSELCFLLGKGLFPISFLRKVETRLFPRCVGFDDKSLRELFATYTYYRRKSRTYKIDDIKNLSLAIYLNEVELLTFDQIISRLYFSRNFLLLCYSLGKSVSYVLYVIIKYYEQKQFAYEQYLSQVLNNGADWRFFDVSFFDRQALYESTEYKGFFVDTQKKLSDNIKHKKQNDLNKIYL